MTDHAHAWLAERADGVPPALGARMQEAVERVAGSAVAGSADAAIGNAVEGAMNHQTVAVALADAARTCLRDALAIGDDRAAALHLLAADALITCACEAAIDEGGEALDRLATSNSSKRLAHLVGGDTEP